MRIGNSAASVVAIAPLVLGAALGMGAALGAGAPRAAAVALAAPPTGAPDAPAWVSPPAEEAAAMAALIDRAAAALSAGTPPGAILADESYMAAHAQPRFRRLIREHAASSRTVIVTPVEPGEPLVVTGSLKGPDGAPLKDALVYVYQTSAKGWYSDAATHISGREGDTRHARLFGYMTTGADGVFEFRTIHPTGYPGSELPAHIHIMVTPAGRSRATLVSEIRFDDDPRMTEAMRANSRRERYPVSHVERAADGAMRVRADFTVP